MSFGFNIGDSQLHSHVEAV